MPGKGTAIPYTEQGWTDGTSGGTPLSAARIQHVEDGVEDADNRLTAVEAGKVDKSVVTTKGDLLAATGNAAVTRVPAGGNGQVLTADSTQAAGVAWKTGSGSGSGSGLSSSLVTTKGDLIVASGAGALTRLGVGTDGQVLAASSTAGQGVAWSSALLSSLSTLSDQVAALSAAVAANASEVSAGPTASRPAPQLGFLYFDSTLGYLICGTGSAWVQTDGTALTGAGSSNAPRNFAATVQSDNSILLSWTAPPGVTVTSYEIDEINSPNGVTGATALPGTATSSVRNPTTLRTYEYWVRALIGGVLSAQSNHATATLTGAPGSGGGGTGGGGTVASSPGAAFNLTPWYLTLPIDADSDGIADTVNQPQLATYTSTYFQLDSSGNMIMNAPVTGATTSSASGATRTEFREQEGSSHADWAMSSTSLRQLTVTASYDISSITGDKRMIVGQIHGASGTPPLYLMLDGTSGTPVLNVQVNGPSVGSILTGVTSTTVITHRIKVNNGTVSLYAVKGLAGDLPSTPQYSWSASSFDDNQDCYFKFGSYNKTANSGGGSGQAVATIIHYDLIQGGVTYGGTASVSGGTGGGSTGGGGTPGSPAALLGIGGSGGYFNLGVGYDSGHVDYPQSALTGGATYPPYFQLNTTNDAVQFYVKVTGGTTSKNTHYPRSELRELNSDGNGKAAWVAASGSHIMQFDTRCLHLPPNKPWTTCGQIHDGTSDALSLKYKGTSTSNLSYVPVLYDTDQAALVTNYNLGDWHTIKIQLIGGTLTIFVDGTSKLVSSALSAKTGAEHYFKAGCYLQTSATYGGFESTSEYGLVEIRNLTVTHSPQL